ncbi:hypothetical protein Pcinc_038498 [Petrolisthes cinctipes]|uniref:Uncharacterized protein n=1 Tax=Petrolisthes cinctipes TaxID=88211 RepID=A0AAE1BU98_PETCI|nr:hypothetical protein Pcinc_038498 [Petrolisthes cinctipes]
MTPRVALLLVGVTALLSDRVLGVKWGRHHVGQMLKLRDQEGLMLKWEGGHVGQMLKRTDQEGQMLNWTDQEGQMLKRTDQEGQMLNWTDHVGQMLVEVVERHMRGCQLVLWTTVSHSPVVSAVLRQAGGGGGGVVVVDGGGSERHQYLPQGVWNDVTITCRGLLLYIDNNNNATNKALKNLELTGLWKKSGVRVLVVSSSSSSSSSSSVKEVLLHPTLRNTVHAVYMILESGVGSPGDGGGRPVSPIKS